MFRTFPSRRSAAAVVRHPRHEDHRGDDEGLVARLPVGRQARAARTRLAETSPRAQLTPEMSAGRQWSRARRPPRVSFIFASSHSQRRSLALFARHSFSRAFSPARSSCRSSGRPPLHHREGGPGFRVDDVGAVEGLLHAAGHLERAAALLAVAAGEGDDLREQPVALRMREGDLHAEAGHEADDPLRHRQRLAVAGRIGPAHRDLLAAQRVERTEVALQVRSGRPWSASGGRCRTGD